MNKFCQSCGMPMFRDPYGGGSDINGTITDEYCSYCYENGVFLKPEIDTAKKMQDYCVEHMRKMKIPVFLAKWRTRKIPKLNRWQQS